MCFVRRCSAYFLRLNKDFFVHFSPHISPLSFNLEFKTTDFFKLFKAEMKLEVGDTNWTDSSKGHPFWVRVDQ